MDKLNNFLKLRRVVILVVVIALVIVFFIGTSNEKEKNLNLVKEQSQQIDQKLTPQILGNQDDLVSFSVNPGDKLAGVVAYSGVVKGAYFFEANILINILDTNKNVLKEDHANATDDWMTVGPVAFAGSIDLSSLPKGPAYLEIHNDNASGMPENDKSILVPIVIE